MVRTVIDRLRNEMLAGSEAEGSRADVLKLAEERLGNAWAAEQLGRMRRVINATGVIIHTNLGRSPLSDAAIKAIAEEVSRYCSLEYDLASGSRSRRGKAVEELLIELTGAEDVLVVNNCAAAAFMVLSVFAAGGEVVISRGELVEIGGDFRVPDILKRSGSILREVGTTNRTKPADYAAAIGPETRLILRVHPSNYRIVGFTSAVSLNELSSLAKEKGLILYEDIGSGALADLAAYGLKDEPLAKDSLAQGADLVTFSCDKLLGGPQAGVIAGHRDLIETLRRDPLYRALRVDKIAYGALEATLMSYRRGEQFEEVPVIKMLAMDPAEIERRARRFADSLLARLGAASGLSVELVPGVSTVGGGTAPGVELATTLVALEHTAMTASRIDEKLRRSDPPVIARIVDDRVVIDLRTVPETDEDVLGSVLLGIFGE